MNTATLKQTPSQPGQGGLPPIAPSSQAILLDKLNARTSTPESEALASSDDEGESRIPDTPQAAVPQPKPVRRSSWLNDTSQQASRPRKGSYASSSMSPTTSHPSTPSAESGGATWGSHSTPSALMGRAPGSSSFSWGTAIWNTERKEPLSRLSEVLPSPTSQIPPGSASNAFFGPDATLSQTSPAPRGEQAPNSQIPFAIPLHPTPKTYRSQSYSVGQLDPETSTPMSMSSSTILGRARPHPHSGIQHRPSRPSMLSEMSNEGGLGKLKEVEDDDDESTTESLQGSQHQSAESKTIEMLTRENAMLRQQQYHNSRLRPRSSTAAAYGLGNGYALRESVPEESDYAIDELDESNEAPELAAKKGLGRRLSEFGSGPFRSPFALENRKLDNVKKAFWQSQLGFGGLGDISQSRRHSFADIPVPTRQASISSIGEPVGGLEGSIPENQAGGEYTAGFPENPNLAVSNPVAASYFAGGGNLPNNAQSMFGNPYGSPYGLHSFVNRAPSPHRNLYGMAQPRHNQLLHIVLFKCARADVFYIQEGTGLTVKPGDLVIVEADRGTDLGTVARDNVDWQMAKDLKEHYAEEQYKWLMMYSQNAALSQEGEAGAGLMASSNGLQGSAVGGMGPPSQHHVQEPNAGELKPKMIKRLAQSHEIHSLRDKEGNEAKAKRVCMQKVKEHGLNMEILDAEFQMDWKKLTFYYFADSYINFNSLVTDLFKIYKTRIWMSAINPASFANPTLGLQAPSGIGPGAVGVGRGSGNAERRQNQGQAEHGAQPQAGRGFQGAFGQAFGPERPGVSGASYQPVGNYPYSQYGAFGNPPRSGNMPFVPGMAQSPESYSGAFAQGGEFQSGRRFPNPPSAGASPRGQSISPIGTQQDWVGAFQGLSLNTR